MAPFTPFRVTTTGAAEPLAIRDAKLDLLDYRLAARLLEASYRAFAADPARAAVAADVGRRLGRLRQ